MKGVSPSCLRRIELCPASARASENAQRTTSHDAERGTGLHAITAKLLTLSGDALGKAQDELLDLDQEDARAVDFCVQHVQAVLCEHPEAKGYSEFHLDASRVFQEMDATRGTPDLILVDPYKWLMVVDFKFGHRRVERPSVNLQLTAYGAMAAYHFDVAHENVWLMVCQPPYAPQAERMSADTLSLCRNALRAASASNAAFNPSEEACRYCPVKETCAARNGAAENAVQAIPEPMSQMEVWPIEKVSAFLARCSDLQVEEVLGSMKARLVAYLVSGGALPDWELKPGRQRNVWKEGAEKALSEAVPEGRTLDALYSKPEFVSPSQARKAWGGSKPVKAILDEWIEKKPGNPTLERISHAEDHSDGKVQSEDHGRVLPGGDHVRRPDEGITTVGCESGSVLTLG